MPVWHLTYEGFDGEPHPSDISEALLRFCEDVEITIKRSFLLKGPLSNHDMMERVGFILANSPRYVLVEAGSVMGRHLLSDYHKVCRMTNPGFPDIPNL